MAAGYGLNLNLEKARRSTSQYRIASDETAKKKQIQVALKTMLILRKDKPDEDLVVKMATIDDLEKSSFRE